MQKLDRTIFEIARELEFFSEKELQMQIGHGRELWRVALLKELIDNALDACETAEVVPEIEVKVESDVFSVRDNGPGLLAETLVRSLDYLKRVSDKTFYVSPTRGQLGNALKVVWAAPFVADGEHGRVEVWSLGKHHVVDVSLDRLAQQPTVERSMEEDAFVKTGTLVKVHWPDLASSEDEEDEDFYKSASEFVEGYAAFNPHATFRIGEMNFWASNPKWMKWNPTDPTSPYWYTPETLRDLIAAYVSQERSGGRVKTVREFISEFRGFSGSAKQKQVTGELKGCYLHDLVKDGDLDGTLVEKLLEAMKKTSNPPKPAALGIIGQDHFKEWMTRYAGISEESFKYAKRISSDGLPHVLEVAFGIHEENRSRIVTGLNWSPTLVLPMEELSDLLQEMRIDEHDPVTVIVHIARPRFEFVDRGKTRVELSGSESLEDGLSSALKSVAGHWKKAKRHADTQDHVSSWDLNHMRHRSTRVTIREVAFETMEEAYLKASGDGRYPANARQIYYAARPRILEMTGESELDSQYFTQTLLKDYLEEFKPEWDVIYDARGHIVEPHTGEMVGLGGLEVRKYISEFTNGVFSETPSVEPSRMIPTAGPGLRYGGVLFIEKEGFSPLLKKARIAERYDVAIASSKGMPVSALSDLLLEMRSHNIKAYAVHDFDKSGFSILSTLRKGARGSQGSGEIIDLGFRLADISGLQRERVVYKGSDPTQNLRENGATKKEINILFQGHWYGERVELNAMASDQLIEWLERKLREHGVKKLIPDSETLAAAYRRAVFLQKIDEGQKRLRKKLEAQTIKVPDNLSDRVRSFMSDKQVEEMAWDEIVWRLAKQS